MQQLEQLRAPASPGKNLFRFMTGDVHSPHGGPASQSPFVVSPVGDDTAAGSPFASPRRAQRKIARAPFKVRSALTTGVSQCGLFTTVFSNRTIQYLVDSARSMKLGVGLTRARCRLKEAIYSLCLGVAMTRIVVHLEIRVTAAFCISMYYLLQACVPCVMFGT